jgi:hypothetical protein
MVKLGRAYRVPYSQPVWSLLEDSGEYPPDFFLFLGRFLSALHQPVWPAGSYFPAGWYRKLAAEGRDPATVAIVPDALGPFFGDEIRLDAKGTWAVGQKIVTGPVLRFFLRNLHYDPALQRYLIRYDLDTHEETRYVHHESLPLRIVALETVDGRVVAHVNDGSTEPLRWDTVRMNAAEQVFVAVRKESLPAQFADGPRFAVLDRLEERGAGWIVREDGAEHPLALEAAWDGSGSLTPLPSAGEPHKHRVP